MAEEGAYLDIICMGCRRQTAITARKLCTEVLSDVLVRDSKSRFRCAECGHRGVHFTLHGHWTGPSDMKPDDWAETAESRVPGYEAP
ncbi:hypothetical protein [Pseudoroseomonas ludipueritiae]|uniref:Uncharacterized protein n=1 Tax=Pseudoroseomonas ludipueritiae TaxID=198093 RepID=A0ABR7RCU6_9PROT|nr:hypothetical protein [Pseudoroseomonas ludipueritiae]MBC9179578.1 hypothetical protein [Pseudoroseomonas ludipueritiae]